MKKRENKTVISIQDYKSKKNTIKQNRVDDISLIINEVVQEEEENLEKFFDKLFKKDRKVASIRLRQNLEKIILLSKSLKREALLKRKDIEKRDDMDNDEIWN